MIKLTIWIIISIVVVMSIHEEVLRAARRLCRERGSWTFTAEEVVRSLPHLNENSVRTHISSRCCVNAPKNHPHKWDYFRRLRRGIYELLPPRRKERSEPAMHVRERALEYGARAPADTVHAVCHRDRGFYVGECTEIAVVTQGRSLDELAANLREAVSLHLEGGDASLLGIAAAPRIVLTYEMAPGPHGSEA
jgi:predicted RNase H-like HicB family nuclease